MHLVEFPDNKQVKYFNLYRMIKYSKEHVGVQLQKAGIIPVFYHADIDVCKAVIKACYNGGVRVFEFVNRGEAALENFPILLEYVHETFPEMIIGIGSIITKEQAEQFIGLEADFIVAPILEEEVALVCADKEKYWIPGCATLSEMAKAEKLGAQIVKAFPGNVLGPGFVKAVLGPMPWLKIMPTGGVEPTEESLRKWYDAGVVCVGMGSQLIKKEILSNKDYAGLETTIKKAFEILNNIQQNN